MEWRHGVCADEVIRCSSTGWAASPYESLKSTSFRPLAYVLTHLCRVSHMCVLNKDSHFTNDSFTHCGLVTLYGDTDLGQYWLGWWFVACRHRAIDWTIVDSSSKMFCVFAGGLGNWPWTLICQIPSDITLFKITLTFRRSQKFICILNPFVSCMDRLGKTRKYC